MGAQYTRMAAMKQTALQATATRLPHTILREQGRSCTVILYDNIQGPFTRQASGEDQEPREYFTFDRYTVDTIYREGLAAAVAADTETWIQNAKEAEASGEQPSELEILTKTVTKQQAQIESINQSVDDITLAILGGE